MDLCLQFQKKHLDKEGKLLWRNVSKKKMLYLNTETALGNDKGNTVEDLCKRLPGVKRTTNNSETCAELGRVLLGVYRLFNVILAHNSLHK